MHFGVARSALRLWMSASFFLFTAFIGFLAMVSGFNSIPLFLLFIYVAWLMVLCVSFSFFFFPCEIEAWNHNFFSEGNFWSDEELPNTAGEVADDMADHSGWLNIIPRVCASSFHKDCAYAVSMCLWPPYMCSRCCFPHFWCVVFLLFPVLLLWNHSYGVPLCGLVFSYWQYSWQ